MKPLNSEERKKAFFRFLGLFIATSGLIVAAVYFGVQVPFKQNDQLKKQVRVYEGEKAFAESFSASMNEVKTELDTINRPGVQTELNDGRISEKLKRMNAMIDADSAADKKFYHNIVSSFADLQTAKKQLRNESGKDASLTELQQQIESLKNDLGRSQADVNNLRMQLSMQPLQATPPR